MMDQVKGYRKKEESGMTQGLGHEHLYDILHQAGEDCGKRRVRRAGDFPGGPVVKTLHFHCRGHGSNPWWEN